MNHANRLLIAAAVCLALGACTKSVKQTPPTDNGQASTTTGASTSPVASDGKFHPEDLDANSCLRIRVVYFDFNDDTLRPEFQRVMACHAKYLRDRPDARMTLEGNADERGTREYNLGLGERRGNAVSAAIVGNGASMSQITVVSYGEERPTCADSTEECWSKNRRVEITYSAR
jgi:peptidoglycan-associated lipoprotein